MSAKIKVLIKDPGKNPRSVNISNRLENLQSYVEGHIEAVTLTSDIVVICNEEGRLMGLPHNCVIGGVDFCGTIILCGFSGEDFSDIPMSYETAKKLFPKLWEV